MKVIIIILILFMGFMCYCLCANASRISRMEEEYLDSIRKSYQLGNKEEENLKK